MNNKEFEKCKSCGAYLKYKPGTYELHCDYCGNTENINTENKEIKESDYYSFLIDTIGANSNLKHKKFFHCSSCGAVSSVENNIKSTYCTYCTKPLVETDIKDENIIPPGYILPFAIDEKQVKSILSGWVKNLWFAPDELKKAVISSTYLQGIYIPYWTYNTDTITIYKGRRGDNYKKIIRDENGNNRTVIRTKWNNIQGSVSVSFDDILISATHTLGSAILKKLEPWNKKAILPFNEKYLIGFVTEKYTVGLENGFELAKLKMQNSIEHNIRTDIGGDSQLINSTDTKYNNITFKHILLPTYISSYLYKNKIYHFYVNGQTGKIKGERPYDSLKIAIVIIWGFAFFLLLIILYLIL